MVKTDSQQLSENYPVGISNEIIQTISELVQSESKEDILNITASLHVADIADLLEQLSKDQRSYIISILSPRLDTEIFIYVENAIQREILKHLSINDIARTIIHLESDDALELIEDLDEDTQNGVIRLLPKQTKKIVEEGLNFPEDSAGRLMQRELVAAPDFWTIGRTLDYIKDSTLDLPEEFYAIFIINAKKEVVGTVSLSKLIREPRETKIKDITSSDLHLVQADLDQEDVSMLFRQYALISAPVVDSKNRLIGMITIDDVVTVIDEEAEEDILNLAGVGESDFHASIIQTSLQRTKWLIVTLINTIIATFVVSHFEHTLENFVALAVLMPITAAMGGNAGLQVVTVTVRSLAMRYITPYNMYRVIAKECGIAILYAIFFASVSVVIAYLWFQNIKICIALALSMLFTLFWAGLAGTTIPILLSKFDIDPAVTAGPFLSATTDVLGYMLFLGFATLLLF